MLTKFIEDKVYYKIFDKSFKQSTYVYSKHKTTDATKLAEIEKNIMAVKSAISSPNAIILNQVHGAEVLDADDLSDYDSNHIADAVVTSKKDVTLCILTADCVPVLMASLDGKLIGAAHCGWRSTKSDILKELVRKMKEKGALTLKALIGPSIQQKSYEVDKDYYESFVNESDEYEKYFIPSTKEGHFMFDLPNFVYLKLQEAGVQNFEYINEDTYSNSDKYPSYRRDCHAGKKYSENILSAIVIR